MKKWRWRLLLIWFSAMGVTGLQGAPAMEKLVLFGPDSAKSWSAAECTLQASTNRLWEGKPTLRWHITVDHFTGEPNYPIGWPRITTSIKEASKRDWSDYDFLHFSIYTETTRAKLPMEPAGLSLQGPDKEHGFARSLPELKIGEWVEFQVPLGLLSRKDDVRSIQFHISESNYRHLDQLDFYISEIALLRFAEPVLLNFEPESAVLFADTKFIPFRFEVAGLHKGGQILPVFVLTKDGEVVVRTKDMSFVRGPQRASFPLASVLSPGEYAIAVDLGNGAQPAGKKVRLLESPWKQK